MSNDYNELPNRRLSDYLWSLPFIILFITIMLGCDFLQRLSYKFSNKILPFFGFLVSFLVLKALKITGLKLEYPEIKIPPNQGLLIVSNHQSLMDIAILWVYFRKNNPHFIAKKELTRYVPFVAFNLRKRPHVIIDRSSPAIAVETLKAETQRIIQNKSAVVIFPEGTRARDGKLKKFKRGGLLAICRHLSVNKIDSQILPVCIKGAWRISSYKLLPVPRNLKVSLKIGKLQPIPKTEIETETLMSEIEDWIKNELETNEQKKEN